LASNTLLFDDDVTDEDLEDSWSEDDKETTTPAKPSADSETVLNVELDAEAAMTPRPTPDDVLVSRSQGDSSIDVEGRLLPR